MIKVNYLHPWQTSLLKEGNVFLGEKDKKEKLLKLYKKGKIDKKTFYLNSTIFPKEGDDIYPNRTIFKKLYGYWEKRGYDFGISNEIKSILTKCSIPNSNMIQFRYILIKKLWDRYYTSGQPRRTLSGSKSKRQKAA